MKSAQPTIAPGSASDANTMFEALAEFPAHRPPDRMYRFFCPQAISSLTEGKLKLTPPIEFNDPFEVWAGLSEKSLTEESVLRSVLVKGGLFSQAVQANCPNYDLQGMDFENRLVAAVKQEPNYWRAHFKSLVDGIASSCAEQTGVSCFSAFTPDEVHGEVGIHHWAMYGHRHCGFMIEYDGTHPLIQAWADSKWLFPVDYVDERYAVDIAYFDEWNDRKMWRTFRHWLAMKSRRAWGHEKEWRLACPVGADMGDGILIHEARKEGGMNYFMKLWGGASSEEETKARSAVISSVTLGARASGGLMDQVLDAVAAPNLRHVDVWKVRADESRYTLVPERLRNGDKRGSRELSQHLIRRDST